MPDNKEGKESKRHSKLAAGIVATSNRLETTQAVLNSLKNVESLEHLLFLKDVAALALSILATIQGIEDRDIDDNLLALALDSCGLLYIIICRCEEEARWNGDVFDQMKVDSGELAKNLHEIRGFVEKMIRRKIFKRIVKHSADGEKVMNYRDQLKGWMKKFGKSTDLSIHDALQEVIDEKLRRREQKETTSKDDMVPQNLHSAATIVEKFSTTGVQPPPPLQAKPVPPKVLDEHPLPAVNISIPVDDTNKTPSRIPTPELHDDRQNIPRILLAVEEKEERERQETEAAVAKTKRLEQERATKRAERERWRKSEQEFIQLPQAERFDEERRSPVVPSNTAPLSVTKPISLLEVESNSELEISQKQAANHTKSASELEDNQIATALHEEIQRQLEAEDEKVAERVAYKEMLEWVAEEKRNGRDGLPPKKKQAKRSPKNSRVHEGPSPEEAARIAIDLEALEALKREQRKAGSLESHRDHTQPQEPDPTADHSYQTGSVFPPGNDPLYHSHSPVPNPSSSYYSPSPLQQPYTSFNNVSGSGISLGGGPVTVSNYNSGNVNTTTITNTGNDYSVRYYRSGSD